jgi:hypothetical protein
MGALEWVTAGDLKTCAGQGFHQKFLIGYGIFKNQQIPHEIKEKALFLSLRVLYIYLFRTQVHEVPSGRNPAGFNVLT